MTRPSEVDEAYKQFFRDLPFEQLKPEWEELFLEWLMFDYKPKSGASSLVEYILKDPDHIEKIVRDQFQQIAQTQKYSLFEILEIERSKWFLLEDIYTGKTYKVYEKKGTTQIKNPGQIPGRVANVDGRWYLVGANSVYFPITYTKRLKGKMKRMELQAKYESLAKEYNVTLSITDLLKKIDEENRSALGDFWQEMMKNGLPEKFFFDQWQLLEDVWNYFPHKCLNGLSPVEMFSKLKGRS